MNLKMIADGLRLIADGLDGNPGVEMPLPAVQHSPEVQKPAPKPAAAQPAAAQPAALNMYAGTTLPAAPVVTREDVITRFTAVMQAHGQDAVIALLKARGLSRVSESSPEQLATLYQDAGALL